MARTVVAHIRSIEWPYTMEDETVEHHYLTAVGLAEYICEWYLMGGCV